MVPSFFIEERLSIYNSQFGEEASGIPMVSRTRKTRLESLSARLASAESWLCFRSVTIKGEPTFSIAPMPASLQRREEGLLPFATGTFAIFRDVIVAQHEFYSSLRVMHTESASKVSGSRSASFLRNRTYFLTLNHFRADREGNSLNRKILEIFYSLCKFNFLDTVINYIQ